VFRLIGWSIAFPLFAVGVVTASWGAAQAIYEGAQPLPWIIVSATWTLALMALAVGYMLRDAPAQ
jgi:hypothetical protein